MKIGLFGGTFDPIHNGHLIAAQEALEYAKLNEVWFLPCIRNVLKENSPAEAEHRTKMIELAVSSNPKFKLSDFELKNNLTYTIDTVCELKKAFPEHEFHWIMGSTLAGQFRKWKNAEQLAKEIKFIIVPTPELFEIENSSLAGSNPLILNSTLRTNIYSTTVREKIKNKQDISYLVPEKVKAYIEEHKLYG